MKVYASRKALNRFQEDGKTLIVYREKQSDNDITLDIEELFTCDSCETEFVKDVNGIVRDTGFLCYECLEHD